MRSVEAFFSHALPYLLPGLWMALGLAAVATSIAATAGLGLALLARSRWRVARVLVATYTEILRNTPLLVQMFFLFFGLPMLGVRFSPFEAAAISLATQHSAFFSEIYRGGLQAVSGRNDDAAKALGLGYWKSMRLVILPLAIVKVLPALANELVQIIKDTSVASTIAVAELTLRGRTLAEQTAATALSFVAVACFYLLVTGAVTVVMRLVEERVRFVE